jgi:hypothetical protein
LCWIGRVKPGIIPPMAPPHSKAPATDTVARPPYAVALPRTADDVVRVAAARDLVVPDACMPGVIANLALLARHVATLRGTKTGAGD